MRIEAVIFDMDGVLVDTEIVYHRQLQRFFAEHGLHRPECEFFDFVGSSGAEFTKAMERWWADAPIKSVEEQSLSALEALDLYAANEVIDYAALLNPGVQETVRGLRDRGVRTAVASSTSHEGIHQALDPLGTYDLFEQVLSGEDFRESKPNPDIYLTSCARLGLSPAECIAVEDSDRGIASALAAGMRVAIKRDTRFGFAQEGGSWYIDAIPELLAIVDAENGRNG